MLIIPCSWKSLEYGNLFLDREYKNPWFKQSKSKSQSNIFMEIVGIFGFICNEGTSVGVYSGGRSGTLPSPTPLFFLNRDGNENGARKFNFLSFKLYRVFLGPLKLSNVRDFSWSWILKEIVQPYKREKKIRRRCMFTSSINAVIVQWTSKKCSKKCNARAQLLFCL